MSKLKIVVVGTGMVGHKFIEELVASPLHADAEIITFCEEPRPAYDRVHLSEYFSGKTADDLSLVSPGFFEQHAIQLHIGDKVAGIDPARKLVTSAKGREIKYDKLVLATGSFPFVPPIPGADREGCFVYRTIEDLDRIVEAAQTSTVGTVVGGGLLGLEAAKAVKDLGLEPHVVEFAPRLMAIQLDEGGGRILQKKIEDLGVQVHTSKNTTLIEAGDNHANKMIFADGEILETDLVVFSAGIRPRDELARDCGLAVGPRGGIVIDNQCRTSNPDIYAIGECALWNQQIFGLVAPGYQMARVVVDHLNQQDIAFTGSDMSTKLKLLGVDVASIGDAHAMSSGARCYSYTDEPNQIYKRIVVNEKGNRLLGAVLVGDAGDYGTLLQVFLNGMDLGEHPDELILPQREGSGATGIGPEALPLSAQICSCYDVTKGQICESIDAGCSTLADLKTQTQASTGCGGCAALLKGVLDVELAKRGVEINTDICEHFSHTRQDLYNIVRAEDIKSFDKLIKRHGRGHGCDICKPAVGSILASYWNDYVLKQQHASLQDTNDHMLANMQKNGTYSVVPRVPGGEITPDKLMVLARVAKKYRLYTKITGAQRIDLFGARVEQLPLIWEELVAAGFESGHAYAKALRTVKTCVGSTWCRYGVDDSVSLGIELENRYKGLRAPHKIKFAVSGCTRECAEAQGKDVGVIATENGWNLYVCGNGGMKPRHADLFATGLDKATLIRTIDRFLMFYVRTADRLQRTSVWMQNMEGGLDYLQSVIIDDKLNICDDLEQQMLRVIGGYECEWKKAVEEDRTAKRFRQFVNSDAIDNRIVFVEERGQLRPATEEEQKSVPTLVDA